MPLAKAKTKKNNDEEKTKSSSSSKKKANDKIDAALIRQ